MCSSLDLITIPSISIIDGTIKLNEHEDLVWVLKNDFYKYDFAEGDEKILSLL